MKTQKDHQNQRINISKLILQFHMLLLPILLAADQSTHTCHLCTERLPGNQTCPEQWTLLRGLPRCSPPTLNLTNPDLPWWGLRVGRGVMVSVGRGMSQRLKGILKLSLNVQNWLEYIVKQITIDSHGDISINSKIIIQFKCGKQTEIRELGVIIKIFPL